MVPVRQAPSLVHAPPVRSQVRPDTYGPRSTTRSVTVRPLDGFLKVDLGAARQGPVGDPDQLRGQGRPQAVRLP